jgi:hypothetical protein
MHARRLRELPRMVFAALCCAASLRRGLPSRRSQLLLAALDMLKAETETQTPASSDGWAPSHAATYLVVRAGAAWAASAHADE